MRDKEIIEKWKAGLSKNKLAEIYRREYNQQIKIIRATMKHRHDGKYISNYEALAYVERVIYKYLKERWLHMTKTIKNLLKAKELIEKKLDLNNNLLETIKVLRQDENSLKEENEAYEIALKLIKKKIKEEYNK